MKGHFIKHKPHISEGFSEEQRKTRVPVDFMESSHKPTICPHQPIFKAAEDAVYFVVFGLVYSCVCVPSPLLIFTKTMMIAVFFRRLPQIIVVSE